MPEGDREVTTPNIVGFNPKTNKYFSASLPAWYNPELCGECDELVGEEMKVMVPRAYKATVLYCKLIESDNICKVK